MARERVLTVEDAAAWRELLPAHVSVFGSVEYARIVQEHTGCAARLFVAESADSRVVYPFFLRPVNALPCAAHWPAPLWDTFTPEFTGPLERRAPPAPARFANAFADWCARNGVVAEFIHLHSFDGRAALLDPACVATDREIVWVDLTLTEDQLEEMSFSHACRRNVRRAERRGVRVFTATTADHVREFHRVYTATMDHNRALARYYFPPRYFLAFFERMPDHALFLLAEHEGRVIAGGLYLHDDTDVYAHLAGSDRAFQHLCGANAEVAAAVRWARREGKKRLVLGGGYVPDDGVFRFKAGFSPLRASFCTYRRVHLPSAYAALCRAWSEYHRCELRASGFFPAYRSSVAAVCPPTPGGRIV